MTSITVLTLDHKIKKDVSNSFSDTYSRTEALIMTLSSRSFN